MAEDAINRAIHRNKLPAKSGCCTEKLFLRGGDGFSTTSHLGLMQDYGVDAEVGCVTFLEMDTLRHI